MMKMHRNDPPEFLSSDRFEMSNKYQYSKGEGYPQDVSASDLNLSRSISHRVDMMAQSEWSGEKYSEYHIARETHANVYLEAKADRINSHNERNYERHVGGSRRN